MSSDLLSYFSLFLWSKHQNYDAIATSKISVFVNSITVRVYLVDNITVRVYFVACVCVCRLRIHA